MKVLVPRGLQLEEAKASKRAAEEAAAELRVARDVQQRHQSEDESMVRSLRHLCTCPTLASVVQGWGPLCMFSRHCLRKVFERRWRP